MRNIIRSRNFYLILAVDICLLVGAYWLSYFIRFEGQIPAHDWNNLESTIPYVICFKLFTFFMFGLYKGMWRYTSLVDLLNLLKATLTSSFGIMLGVLFMYRFQGFARSVFIIDGMLTFIFIGGFRVGIRLLFSETRSGLPSFREVFIRGLGKGHQRSRKRLVIIGAGDAGEKILREIRDNPRLNYEVVGFLDDDPKKKGMRIHGIPVLGSLPRIHDMAYRDEMDEILIAIPSANARQMRRIIEACEGTGLKSRTTPGIGELIDGKISFSAIREVSYEDLLGRDPIDLDMKSIGDYLKNRVILVTGAAGSIGSELCRQIAQLEPKNLILFDKTNSLFILRWNSAIDSEAIDHAHSGEPTALGFSGEALPGA
jgi:FlaA1/EpsC-like NDP-sugar epimerase